MLKINILGQPFALTFKHVQFEKPQTGLLSSGRPVRAHTSCAIYKTEEGKVNYQEKLSYGIAFCSSLDKFEKERGRRLALAKALSRFPKAVRRDIFEQYEGRRG